MALLCLVVPLPGPIGLIKALVHFWAVLPGSTTFDDLLDNTVECTDAHSSLSMPRQGVVASK
jgi:hypothetical protein